MKKAVLILAITSLGVVHSATAADAAAGKAGYQVCVACHGAKGEGNAALNAPALAGLQDWYVTRQINNYKLGIRGSDPKDSFGAQMKPMAAIVADDSALANLSAYIATLPAGAQKATLGGDPGKGKSLYATCAACHGQKAEGVKALNGPRLSGQHDWYLVRQLQNFKTGVRGGNSKDSLGAQMRPMASMLADDQAMKDVAAYIGTLR